MGSKKGRTIHTWRTPAKMYCKCLLAALYDEGLRGSAMLAAFGEMVPGWRNLFGGEISDDAPLQRADKARRYETEMPENHPTMKKMWPQAKRDVKERKRWTLTELRAAYPDKPQKMAA
jgi:hypothetical protein